MDCRVVSYQCWRSVVQIQAPDDGIILKVWQIITLQPFNLQRLTVPVQKDIDLLVNISSAQETSSILKKGIVLSKWPYFHQANSVTFRNQNFVAVLLYRVIHRFALHISTQSSTQICDTHIYTEFYTEAWYTQKSTQICNTKTWY